MRRFNFSSRLFHLYIIVLSFKEEELKGSFEALMIINV